MNDDLLPLEDVRFIQIRGEPSCGAWIDGCEATPLTAYGAPEALDDALFNWHVRWFWSTSNPEGANQVACDAEGLALAREVKAWVGPSVEVRFVPVEGVERVMD